MQTRTNEMEKELLLAGVHLGHQKRKWNPKMLPYIYSEKAGIHLIDLNRTIESMQTAAAILKQLAKNGKKILFVATKKQAKSIVKEVAQELNVHYVTERWLGGMLTNFVTVRRSIKKMQNIEKTLVNTEVNSLTKKEKLSMEREKNKIVKVLGGVSTLNTIPGCIFLVDIGHEHIALAEAKKLGITTIGIVDTNNNPQSVDYPIPANDDSTKSIAVIIRFLAEAIKEGMEERKQIKEDEAAAAQQEENIDDKLSASKYGDVADTEENEERKKANAKVPPLKKAAPGAQAGGMRKRIFPSNAPPQKTRNK